MKLKHILFYAHVASATFCYGMEYFGKFVDIVSQVPQQLVARIRHEEHHLEKPALSPLPQFMPELLKIIAFNLDGQSMAHFASCCSSINQTLNASYHWAAWWHRADMRAPLKIIKEYVAHNEELIEQCVTCTPQQLQAPECKHLVAHPLTDFNYCRIQKSHWNGILFNNRSYAIKPEQYKLDDDDKKILYAEWGPRQLVVKNMVHILCAKAEYSESVRFLLEQRADPNCPYGERPIQGALDAFDYEELFPGNVNRCVNMVNILLSHKADIHYKTPDGFNYLHVVADCDHANFLLPYFIKHGVGVNDTNTMGDTPLLTLAKKRVCARQEELEYFRTKESHFLESIQLLIAAKADLYTQNNANESLFSYLSPRLHQDVQAMVDDQSLIRITEIAHEVSGLLHQ